MAYRHQITIRMEHSATNRILTIQLSSSHRNEEITVLGNASSFCYMQNKRYQLRLFIYANDRTLQGDRVFQAQLRCLIGQLPANLFLVPWTMWNRKWHQSSRVRFFFDQCIMWLGYTDQIPKSWPPSSNGTETYGEADRCFPVVKVCITVLYFTMYNDRSIVSSHRLHSFLPITRSYSDAQALLKSKYLHLVPCILLSG